MVERKYETKRHVVTDRVLVYEHRFCDFCKKEIKEDYWEIRTQHFDWGNDSVDSIEDFDACCPACVQKAFDTYIKDSSDGINTCRIEVEHCNWSGVKGDISYDKT